MVGMTPTLLSLLFMCRSEYDTLGTSVKAAVVYLATALVKVGKCTEFYVICIKLMFAQSKMNDQSPLFCFVNIAACLSRHFSQCIGE